MRIFHIIIGLVVTLSANAQDLTERYRNAFNVGRRYNGKVINGNVQAHPKRGTSDFWYSVFNGDSTIYYNVDSKTGTKTLTANPEPPRRRRQNNGPQHHWMEVRDEKDGRSQWPKDRSKAMIHKDNNLFLGEKQVTFDGTDTCYYSSWGRWSDDGRYYATVLIKPAPKHYVYMVESSPRNQVQPNLIKQEYAKPGDSLNYRIPVIVDVENGHVSVPSTELFARQYDVSAPVWDKDFRSVTFEFNERGHHTFRVLEMDLEGNVRTLIEEKSDKYVAYSRNWRHDLDDGRILWKSDRDGHAHLYLYDRKGNCKQVTKGDFWVRGVQHVDEAAGVVYFTANGRGYKNMGIARTMQNGEEGSDPYLIHYYRIGLDGKHLTDLTPEKANHEAVFSSDHKYLIDTYSTVLQAPVTVLRSADNGRIISTLETADITRLRNSGWTEPEVFVAPGRDGKTDMWGLIRRPRNFDPSKTYPVIEYIYSGPGDQYVPKAFTPWLWNFDDLTELGFIVVQLDGMGTSFRTLDFEQNCYKNLQDAGFPDREAWIRAAAAKYPYMDISNMGIYGSSAGGQEALAALLFHGDFYKNAYSAAGCHDNRMDKIWWNEQWMSYPVDESYEKASNVVNAKKLQGNLMLVVGELDDNVDPASTMQVVNALERANKDFELVFLPGVRHTMGESYGQHKRYDFFVRNMLKLTPPKWNEINGTR